MTNQTTTEPPRSCAICGRRIRLRESIERRIGPKCLRHLQEDAEKRQARLFEDLEEAP